jgi:hypothetical protein
MTIIIAFTFIPATHAQITGTGTPGTSDDNGFMDDGPYFNDNGNNNNYNNNNNGQSTASLTPEGALLLGWAANGELELPEVELPELEWPEVELPVFENLWDMENMAGPCLLTSMSPQGYQNNLFCLMWLATMGN